MLKIYGIKNCDTMKKAFAWLNGQDVTYAFHDYKKQGADAALIKRAIALHGWDKVLNLKGTTWRKLPDSVRSGMDAASALAIAKDNPSIIRRPLVVAHDGTIVLGFDAAAFKLMVKS